MRKNTVTTEDLYNMSEKEIVSFVKKQMVWQEPDYTALYNEGCYREDLYFLKLCYNAIGATIPTYLEQSVRETATQYINFINTFSNYLLVLVRKHMLLFEYSVLDFMQRNGYLMYEHNVLVLTNTAKKNPVFSSSMYKFLNKCVQGFTGCTREQCLELRTYIAQAHGKRTDTVAARIDVLCKTVVDTMKENMFIDCYITRFPEAYQSKLQGTTAYKTENKGATTYIVNVGDKSENLHIEYPVNILDNTDTKQQLFTLIANGTVTRDIQTILEQKKRVLSAADKETAQIIGKAQEVKRVCLYNDYVLHSAPRLRKGDTQITSLLYNENNENVQACFNFEKVEFNNKDRQQECLNCAVDSFSDLAFALDIPFSAVSLGLSDLKKNRISIIWTKKKDGKTHYNVQNNTIYLAEYSGAGMLAYAWGAALDYILGQWCVRNVESSAIRQDGVLHTLTQIQPNTSYGEQENTLIHLMQRVIHVMFWKQGTSQVNENVETPTKYSTDAKYFDFTHKKPFYSTIQEMFLRAFEAFVEDKLKEYNVISEYLVYGTNGEHYAKIHNGYTIYPMGEERKIINAQIQNLLDYVCDNIICERFSMKYRKYYISGNVITEKFFDISNTLEKKKAEKQVAISVAHEDMTYGRGAMEAGRVAHIEAEPYAEGVRTAITEQEQLNLLNGELVVPQKSLNCIVTAYNQALNVVTVRTSSDVESVHMPFNEFIVLVNARVLCIIRGVEYLPNDIFLGRIPVMT